MARTHLAEALGTFVAALGAAAGVFVLFLGMGLATRLVFMVVLKPGASSAYVVATAIAALLVVAAGVLLVWALARRLTHLRGRFHRRATPAG